MYTCVMLILINWYLLNVFFSMAKALNGQSSLKQNLYSPPAFPYASFLFIRTPFFVSNFIKFHLTSLQSRFHVSSANQIQWIFQIDGNNLVEISYLIPYTIILKNKI